MDSRKGGASVSATDPGITSIPALDAAEQEAEALNIAEHILATGNLPAACIEPLCWRAIAPGSDRRLGHAQVRGVA